MRALFPACAALLLVGGLPGCGKGGSAPTVADPATRTWIEVQNGSSNAMTISVVRAGIPARLGEVGAGSTAKFELPKALVSSGVPVRFTAEIINQTGLIRRSAPVVQDIPLRPGGTARFSIPPG